MLTSPHPTPLIFSEQSGHWLYNTEPQSPVGRWIKAQTILHLHVLFTDEACIPLGTFSGAYSLPFSRRVAGFALVFGGAVRVTMSRERRVFFSVVCVVGRSCAWLI